MLSHNYSYQECLDNSKKVAWKEDDVFAGKNFDFSKRFLPNRLSGVDNITCLNDNEKRQLNQIMGNAYCHIFAFVEEFIIPMVTQAALKDAYGEKVRLRSLLRFAEEELKHQELFRRAVAQSVPGPFFSPELARDIAAALAAELGLRPTRRNGARFRCWRATPSGRSPTTATSPRISTRVGGCPANARRPRTWWSTCPER